MSKYPSQMQDKFNLRFPDGMRDAIAERAKRNGRSMNSEIIQIIQDALGDEKLDSQIVDFADHESAISELASENERDNYLNDLEKEDAFAAALLRESEEHSKRLIKILGERFEVKDLNKKT